MDTNHPPVTREARIVEGVTIHGRACRIVDNSGTLSATTLEDLLTQLIRERRFGRGARSASGEPVLLIDAPQFSHVQLEGRLYRLILFPYEARLEPF